MSVLNKICLTHDKRDAQQDFAHAPITGVAPGAIYDSTIDLLFPDDSDTPTVKRAAVSPVATLKMPVVTFEREVQG